MTVTTNDIGSTPMPVSFNNTRHNMDFAQIRSGVGVVELVYFLIGTPSNLLVLFMCWQLSRNAHARNFNQYFVLSMTMADLMSVSLHSSLVFVQYTLHYFNTGTCLTLYIATYVSATASSLSLLCLNIDKFIYLMKPLHYVLIVTKKRVQLTILFVWITAITLSMLLAFGPGTKYRPPCEFSTTQMELYALFFTLCFVLPVCISFVISVLIASLAIRVRKERQDRLSRYSNRSSTSAERMGNFRSVLFVFTTTIWSAATCMPYRISYIIYKTMQLYHNETVICVFYILLAILSSNPVGNPMITVITQSQYMSLLKLWLTKLTANLVIVRARTDSKISGNSCGVELITQNTCKNTPDTGSTSNRTFSFNDNNLKNISNNHNNLQV